MTSKELDDRLNDINVTCEGILDHAASDLRDGGPINPNAVHLMNIQSLLVHVARELQFARHERARTQHTFGGGMSGGTTRQE